MAMDFCDLSVAEGRLKTEKISPQTRLHLRTRELASIAGRGEFEITQFDYEQAKRELKRNSKSQTQQRP